MARKAIKKTDDMGEKKGQEIEEEIVTAKQEVSNDVTISETTILANNNEETEKTEVEVDENTGVKEAKAGKKEDITVQKHEKENMIKRKKTILICIIIVSVMLISFVVFCVCNKLNTNIYGNVYLNGKLVSKMNTHELGAYVESMNKDLVDTSVKLFQEEENILEIVPGDIDFEVDIEATQKQILNFGRSSNILKNNIDILFALVSKKEFGVVYNYDTKKLSDICKEVKASLNGKTLDDSYTIDTENNKLIITTGKTGLSIKEEELKEDIINMFLKGKAEDYIVKTLTTSPTKLDIDVVYSQVFREPKDAYVDKTGEKIKLVFHEVGYNFDKEDLRNLLAKPENLEEGKTIEYPLIVTEPKILTKDIAWDLYEYQISSYTTWFSTGDANRVNNLRVALSLLNDKVIMPGETFSYNSVVGAATEAQGFKPAATFVGGRVVREVGGGICQTVSTLYNVALLANMEITQRKAHSLPVAYVPASRDATVYYPSVDFKFKNNREYPVKIATYFNSNGSLTISLYGTKEDKEYEVSISSSVLSYSGFDTVYTENADMNRGEQVVNQNGSSGYTSEAYITKKLNGTLIESKLLSRDTYKSVAKLVTVGTREVVSEPVSVPELVQNEQTQGNNQESGNSQGSTTP